MRQFGGCSPESHVLVFDINGKMIWYLDLPVINFEFDMNDYKTCVHWETCGDMFVFLSTG